MWEFFGSVFSKATALVMSVLVAVGLIAAPLPPAEEALISETSTRALVEEAALDQSEGAGKSDSLTTTKTEKDDSVETKKLEEKLAQTAQLLEVLKKVSSPPVLVPSSPIPPTPSLPSGTFRLPNGTLVDANGNIIQSAVQSTSGVQTLTSVAASTETDYSQYANPPIGTTLQILKSVAVSIEFNSNLSCEDLGFSFKQRNGYLCKLYKIQKSNYSWEMVESYTQDLSQYKQTPGTSSGTSSSSRPSVGSTITLPRSIFAAIGLNPDVFCESLGFSGENLNSCKLYKDYKNDYTWNIVD